MLGNNLARELVGRGHEVRVLVRSGEKAVRLLGDLEVEFIQGDMTDVEDFAPALDNVDVVFHTAAYFRETLSPGAHWPMLERINVANTIRLFEEAASRDVGKVIHTSSNTTIRKREDGRISDESDTAAPGETLDLYAKSKILGDEAIAEFVKIQDTPVVTIKPSLMFGPNDAAPTGGGQFVLDFLNRRLPVVLDSGIDVTDARDVARVMLAAANHSEGDKSYIAAAHYVSQYEMMSALEEVTGVPAPTRSVPTALALAVAWANGRIGALTNPTSSLSVNGIRAITEKKRTSSAKAERELGATFRPLEETMRDTAAWYLDQQPEKVKGAALIRSRMSELTGSAKSRLTLRTSLR